VPRVILAGSACRQYTGGRTELEVEATTIRRLILELDERFPGFGRQIEDSMAVVIDGVICQDTYLESFGAASEIVLMPKIAGG
jgi:sulfur-carrier protein